MGGFFGAVGGGGGGGGQQIWPIEMDTSIGMGMLNLSAESSYNVGDILIITSSDPPGGGFIFPNGADTIGGEMNRSLGAAQTLLLQATGTGDWDVLASAPDLYRAELADGGDTFTLPQLSTLPQTTCYLVVFNNTGTGAPVTINPYSGDSITGGSQSIDTLYQGMIFRHSGFSWEPYTQTSGLPTPAATTLTSIAIANAALHCWFGRTDPFIDLAGSADFSRNAGQCDIPPIPECVEGLIESNPEPAAFAGPLTGATACSLSRSGSDRSFAWLFRLSADDPHSDSAILRLGVTTKGLCTIRAQTSILVDDPATWPSGTTTLFSMSGQYDKWILLTGWWEEAENILHLYWSIDGGAEGSNDHEATDSPATGEDQIQLGYSNAFAASVFHGFLAIWDDSTGVDIRGQFYAALGWEV